ncbi:MAG: hypothetical protein JWO44_753 [Bacteroidetes bacterium]|nr:hypothetical protein [Bacteroidota bacterium]
MPVLFCVSTITAQLKVDASGRVGVVTTTMNDNLCVSGGTTVDYGGANTGTTSNTLKFGSGSGEAIGSKRSSGGNQYGLDFYTNFIARFSVTNSGNVNLVGGSNGYQIAGEPILWYKGDVHNIFVGFHAGVNVTSGSGLGTGNTLTGCNSGVTMTTGNYNTAAGDASLYAVTSGSNNSAMGYYALSTQTTATDNSAFGYRALTSATGGYNTATGSQAMYTNTTGAYNSAYGYLSLNLATSADYNAAYGYYSLKSTTTGNRNVAVGSSLSNNTTGSYNVSCGHLALNGNTTTSGNTACGAQAGYAPTTGSNNTYIGYTADAGSNYSNSTALGYAATVNASNKVRIGNSSVTVIEGQVAFTSVSDGRFKYNITENVKGLEFIKKLRPVNYQFNTSEFDQFVMQNMPDSVKAGRIAGTDYNLSSKVIHTGFIAQEVEAAAKEAGYVFDGVHAPADKNDNYGLAYSQFVVPLVKAVQELSQQADNLKSGNAKLDSVVKAQNEKINALQNQLESCCTMSQQSSPGANAGNATNNLNGNGISDEASKTSPALYQNAPNPFSQQTSIGYFIPVAQSASIMIFDLNGKFMLERGINSFGKGAVIVNGNDLNAGMYVYSLIVDGKIIDTKRMILTK